MGQAITPVEEHDYWQLQRNQEAIGWDNLLRGEFAKDWRKLNGVHNRKLKDIQRENEKVRREQKKLREAQEKERELYWDPMRPLKNKRITVVPPEKKKRKADVFQRVFTGIIRIIRELWLECNTDWHQPLQGQKRIARITEATRTVTELYSLRSQIMNEHESKYFAIPLEEMVQQSAPRMLAWATRWKIGIYTSVRRATLASKKMTVPIWKMWEPGRKEPVKKVDKRRLQQTRQKKYKASCIRNKQEVTESKRSTSRVPAHVEEKNYLQATFDTLEEVVLEKNEALYGDAFNDYINVE